MLLTIQGFPIPVAHEQTFPVFNIQKMALALDPPMWWNVGVVVLVVLFIAWLGVSLYLIYRKNEIVGAVLMSGILGFALLGGFWFVPQHRNVTCELKSEKFNILVVNEGQELRFRNSGDRSVKMQVILSAIEAVNLYVPEGPVLDVAVGESKYYPPRGRLAQILMAVPKEEPGKDGSSIYNLHNCSLVMEGL